MFSFILLGKAARTISDVIAVGKNENLDGIRFAVSKQSFDLCRSKYFAYVLLGAEHCEICSTYVFTDLSSAHRGKARSDQRNAQY